MLGFLRRVVTIALLAASSSPAGAQAQSAATQAPQAASGPDIPALVARIDAVRLHYTSSRVSAARDELSGTLDQVRATRAAEGVKATTLAAGQLPRAGRDVPMPGLLKRVEPDYPIEAAKKGVTGHVVLDARDRQVRQGARPARRPLHAGTRRLGALRRAEVAVRQTEVQR